MNRIQIKDIWNLDTIIDDGLNSFIDIWANNTSTYPLVVDIFPSSKAEDFNIDYLVYHSADKVLSGLAQKIYDKYGENNHNTFIGYLAGIIYNRFASKWKKLYDALNTLYNPLENYSMKEKRTPYLTTKDVLSGSTKSDTESGVFGFNANNSKRSGTNKGEQINQSTNTRSETGHEDLERAGNIGVTTSQQMLESEFEVRKHDLYNLIYNDIDSILCMKIY